MFTRAAQGLDWSPDGKQFVWHESKLYRMPVKGPRTPIAVEIEPGSKPTYPRWNPNWKPDLE